MKVSNKLLKIVYKLSTWTEIQYPQLTPLQMTLTDLELSLERELIKDQNAVILSSKETNCKCCKYGKVLDVPRDNKKDDSLVIYTRSGTLKGYHQEKRCNNQRLPCRAGHYCGFIKPPHSSKKFDKDVLKHEYFITSFSLNIFGT